MFGPTAEVEMAAYDKMFVSNVRAPLFLVGALAPGLVERRGGSIISLSSMAGGVGSRRRRGLRRDEGVARGDDSRLAGQVQREPRTRQRGCPGASRHADAPGAPRSSHALGGDDADAPRIASRGDRRGHRVPRVRPRALHHRRDDRRRRWTSSGLDRHDAVWAQAHDDPDHVNRHQGAGHV